MDIQFVKISLPVEESAEALPIVMRAIAAAPAALPQPMDFGQVPKAFRATATEPKRIAPEQPAKTEAKVSAKSPSETQPATQSPAKPQAEAAAKSPAKPQIAPPTGSVKKAKAMIFDARQNRYRQRTLWDRVIGVCDRCDDWCEAHSTTLAIVVGGGIGLALLYACIRFDLPERVQQRFSISNSPALVKSEPAPEPTKEDSPADASEKSGQPKKLPLSEGAIK